MAASAEKIASVLASLRDSARVRRASEAVPERRVSSGFGAIDAALDGGLERGRLAELCGPRSSGRLSIAVSIMRAAEAAGEWVAFVDVADAFDPRSAEAAGLSLDRLLWVRPRTVLDGFKAADLILDAGGFGLVVVYLCGVPISVRRVAFDAITSRLKHRAEQAKAAVLLATDAPMGGTAVRLKTTRARGRWQKRLLQGIEGVVAVERKQTMSDVSLVLELL